jgi:3-hydroxyacyl-CoA dehydrogenase/enoyl-CoA hydratase/3-hydroxybutyryl-CoA epimerase
MEAGLRCEAEKVGFLLTGDVSRNLVRIFQASRRDPKGPPGERGREARRIGILGAGVMGGAIGAVAAGRGIAVRLRDVGPKPLEKGLSHAHAILGGRGRRRRPASWTESRFIRIAPTLDLSGFTSSDLILEAVIEDLDLKRRVLAEAEKAAPAECTLATNTSSLSVDAIASALQAPERFIGLHFFNPAERMPLVEVVRGSRTSAGTVATALAFARKLGKTPVLVGDAPGFVVNRLLMPYLSEAVQVVARGGDVEAVDRTMVRFGLPIGPLALLDQIGLDVAAKVAAVLAAAFGERLPSPAGLQALAAAGLLGAKGGAGFYVRRGRKRQVNARAVEILRSSRGPGEMGAGGDVPDGERLAGRLLHPVINEAARLLEEGVAGSPEIVDLAMVFGTGFPPFRGGPLRWADVTGVPSIVASLGGMAAGGAGDHLAPSEALERVAAGTGRFHADR